jgi:hypothetical protein
LFIIKCLSLLEKNGILSFIIPTSFLNSAYYNNLRKYIYEKFTILNIINFNNMDDFIETKQQTIGIIIKKSQKNINDNFAFEMTNLYIFSDDIKTIKTLLKNTTTLSKLNFKVKTGTIVWNQHKDDLTDDKNKPLLIYNSDIKNNKFTISEFKNTSKKRYINLDHFETTPIILVNRGNGNSKYKFNYYLLNDQKNKYLIENHINIIYGDDKTIDDYNKIIKSFRNKKTNKFIKLFFGNNGMSKTELENYFPIYI